ncbi:DUF4931 domain-containing protein [Bacillus sp. V5-8f]|uniref:DUF4931 domain-containing protein n=1 Tax=Bacillus sp. V5-8f TaxID=2053044 RepID=UPI000C775DAC|nr:DUF4931 domain-containing protein [Bacillus sp. V5-8f]PLT35508.1 DUF4931 domain-containing protein [Bacillus sp. V5-8f]
MDTEHQLHFITHLGKQKPQTLANKSTACPFCAIENLENIIAQEGPLILLQNKYKTLQNTFQTVLIETDKCADELSIYPKEHLHKLFTFAVRHWMEMEKSGVYRSVVLFKNHGRLSGGTIRHPHMQIVGLEKVDYKELINEKHFEGISIYQNEKVLFTLSNNPIIGFYEFNVMIQDMNEVRKMADCVQAAVKFLLNDFQFKCESYNLFFYHMDSYIACKIIPRFVSSPYFIGYMIPQVPNDIENVADQIKSIYFS